MGERANDAETAAEFQESVAMALIKNQYLSEENDVNAHADREPNDPEQCQKHPKYKSNICKFCYKRKTVYVCMLCSNPGQRRLRLETGPKNGAKYTDPGYMHFCKGGCYFNHKCGGTAPRRRRGCLQSPDAEFEI